MQEGRPFVLIDDACLSNSSQNLSEVLRCIHISLPCVQQRPVDRPSTSSVIMMLACEVALDQPKPLAFLMESKQYSEEADCSSTKHLSSSTNDMTHSNSIYFTNINKYIHQVQPFVTFITYQIAGDFKASKFGKSVNLICSN